MLKEFGFLLAISAAEKILSKFDDNNTNGNSYKPDNDYVMQKSHLDTNVYRKTISLAETNLINSEILAEIAFKNTRRIKRITDVSINNAIITCTVNSQSGISEWDFTVDFNDWGYITGEFWLYSDNDDSNIPKVYGNLISEEIKTIYNEKNVKIVSIDGLIKNCSVLNSIATIDDLEYIDPKYKHRSIFKKEYFIDVDYDSMSFAGLHLIIAFVILYHSGFKRIICEPVEVNGFDTTYEDYEVKEVVVNNDFDLVKGTSVSVYSTITIYYYKLVYKTTDKIKNFFKNILS